jgi:hypothetical protein
MSSRVQIDDIDDIHDNDEHDGRQHWLEARGSRERLELVREAGWSRVSWLSVMAGVLAAVGTLVLFAGIAAAVLHPLGITAESLSDSDWKRLGLGVGLAAAAGLLAAFAFGGYVAGRVARRAGVRHGVLVFVAGAVLLAGAAGIAQVEGALSAVRDQLEGLGAPTGVSTWTGVGTVSGAVALAGMLLGSLLGGVRGERWHQRLVARALNPDIGPDADLRADVEARRKAAAKALAKARKAGVLPVDDEPTDGAAPVTEVGSPDTAPRSPEAQPAPPEPARADNDVRWRGVPEPTGAGPARRPSSPS